VAVQVTVANVVDNFSLTIKIEPLTYSDELFLDIFVGDLEQLLEDLEADSGFFSVILRLEKNFVKLL
jgi:hypothetical protein